MNDKLQSRIYDWDMADIATPRVDYIGLLSQINYLAEKLYSKYEPSQNPSNPDFLDRLMLWLDNVDEVDQQTLLRLVPHIFFVGREEFDNLYRVAFNWPVASWLLDQLTLKLDDPGLEDALKVAVNNTWFCPITDSMRINSFYHLNFITSGINYRPDFSSLSQFECSKDKITAFIQEQRIERIVLLEDFVGSGSQLSKAVKFAATLSLPTLIVPLIICPKGVKKAKKIEATYKHVSFAPVVKLPASTFVTIIPSDGEPSLFPLLRNLVERVHPKVCGKTAWPHLEKPYGPFGYRATGSLVVTYSNCPNNTLPIIHHKHTTWSPLFLRATRV